MKPLKMKNYGSIGHLSSSKLGMSDSFINEGQERMLTKKRKHPKDEIFVYEKLDGSNVGVAKVEGEIIPLTRSGYVAQSSPYKQHHVFAEWVSNNERHFDLILNEGERITGEWLYQTHSIRYLIKIAPIVFFDIFSEKNVRLTQSEFYDRRRKYSFPVPRLLHRGGPICPSCLITVLNDGGSNFTPIGEEHEGMVYRYENHKGKVSHLAKWVRKDFEPLKVILSGVNSNNISQNGW